MKKKDLVLLLVKKIVELEARIKKMEDLKSYKKYKGGAM